MLSMIASLGSATTIRFSSRTAARLARGGLPISRVEVHKLDEDASSRSFRVSSDNMPRKSGNGDGSSGTPSWHQEEIIVSAPSRGFHLITDKVYQKVPQISEFSVGMAHLFIKHTSASLSVNENCDPDVRSDMEGAFNRIVPEKWNKEFFKHTMEGPDDMPAHVKATIIGPSVQIPITDGKFNLGTWQGVYLCEHRNTGGYGGGHSRKIVVTLQGLRR